MKTQQFACCCSRQGRSDRHPFIHMPAGFPRLKGGPYQWAYHSVPQEHSNGRSIPLPQGRGLGGGGSINSQVFTRGVDEDYDGWVADYGCEGWSAAEVSSILSARSPTPGSRDPTTEPRGRLASRTPSVRTRSRRPSCRPGRSSGCRSTATSTAPNSTASASTRPPPGTAAGAARPSPTSNPRASGRNLTVRVNVTVSKVVIKDGRAVGIQTIEGGVARIYGARREVIVASGAFGSPKLLQLSGIGDPADLAAAGIDVSMPSRASGRTCRTTGPGHHLRTHRLPQPGPV